MVKNFKDTFENLRRKKKRFLCFNFEFKGKYIRISYAIFNIIMFIWVMSYTYHLDKISGTNANNNSYSLIFCIILSFIFSMILYFIVSFSDPGRIQDDSSNTSKIQNKSLPPLNFNTISEEGIDNKQNGFEISNCIINTDPDEYQKNKIDKNKQEKGISLDLKDKANYMSYYTPRNGSKNMNEKFKFEVIKCDEINLHKKMVKKCGGISNTSSSADNSIVEYEVKETIANTEMPSSRSARQIRNYPDENIDQNSQNISSEDLSIYEGRYCMECHINIPLRCKHCVECGMCIATFDHHCSWTARCVGEKNKLIFLLYLMSKLVYLILVIVNLIFKFKQVGDFKSYQEYFVQNLGILILSLFCGLFIIFVWTLLKFQIQLMLCNQTTWENYCWHKIQYMLLTTKSQKSPFDRGMLKNLEYVFCIQNILKRVKSNYIIWRNEVDLGKI